MHPVQVSDEDVALLKKARSERNWKILTSWKQRYLYQRLVALPTNDKKSIQEIAELARDEMSKKAYTSREIYKSVTGGGEV